jgi:ATP-dependent helicase/nuclease subunit A
LSNWQAFSILASMGLTIYKSSAGSGKTFTLVRLYLEKVIRSPYLFRRILAITFTNKATEEMKSRIILELKLLADGHNSSHLQFLQESTKIEEAEIRKRAGEVLLKILHEYSSFSVSTIDSYFQVLSRTLAKELKLPVKYNIELDLDSICDAVTEQLLSLAGKNDAITGWLKEMLVDRIDQGKNWNISSELKKMVKEIVNRSEIRHLAESIDSQRFFEFIRKVKTRRDEIAQNYKSISEEIFLTLKKAGYDYTDYSYKSASALSFCNKVIANTYSIKTYEKISNRFVSGVEDPLTMLSKEKQKDDVFLNLTVEVIHPLMVQLNEQINETLNEFTTAIEVLQLSFMVGVLTPLNDELKNFRDENQLFLLSDTTRMLREAVRDTDAPFIYEKSGNSYSHLFIDEFQDTGNEQWQILKPLVTNSIANGNDVLIVGDAKQSIYRWRGGNMNLLLHDVRKQLNQFSSITKEEKLDTNYRSLQNIVEFNNQIFEKIANAIVKDPSVNQLAMETAYQKDALFQKHQDNANGGYIAIDFFESDKKEKKSNTSDQDTEEENEGWKAKSLQKFGSTISDALSRGYHLKDIACIVRTGDHESEVVKYLLEKTNYAFISGNSLKVAFNEKVLFLISCMRLLLDPENKILHEEINFFIDRSNFKVDGIERNINFRNQPENTFSKKVLLANKTNISQLPVHLCYLQILKMSGLDKPDVFTDKLTDIIIEFANSNGTGISEFITWWDEKSITKDWSIEMPDSIDAIRIITIHRSKGLQYPIVIMPIIDWTIIPKPQGIIWAKSNTAPYNEFPAFPLYSKKSLISTSFGEDYLEEYGATLIDNLNLLYVAFTRAERELYLFSNLGAKENSAGKLLIDSLSQNPIWLEQINSGIQIGEKTTPATAKKKESINSLNNPLNITSTELEISVQSSFIPEVNFKFESEETVFGNYIHNLLFLMDKKDDLEYAFHQLVVKESIDVNSETAQKIKNETLEIWELMEKQMWTDKHFKVEKEIDICDKVGILHRPDRVLISDDEVIIIDFKTGSPNKKYHQQVNLYCSLFKEMGHKSVKGYLLYTKTKSIEMADSESPNNQQLSLL